MASSKGARAPKGRLGPLCSSIGPAQAPWSSASIHRLGGWSGLKGEPRADTTSEKRVKQRQDGVEAQRGQGLGSLGSGAPTPSHSPGSRRSGDCAEPWMLFVQSDLMSLQGSQALPDLKVQRPADQAKAALIL